MSTTNKLLAGAAILVAAYAGSSWYVGKKAEAEINHQVNEINAAIATQLALSLGEGEIKLNVVDYDRGWFNSSLIVARISRSTTSSSSSSSFWRKTICATVLSLLPQ